MSAIAGVLIAMGHEVSGSDQQESSALDHIRALGSTIFVGHSASNLADVDVLTRSTAISDNNPEIREAFRKGIQVVSRAEMLASIGALREVIAVAGTHGKTSTSAMLAMIMLEAGLEPSFVVGGVIGGQGNGYRLGSGDWMVVEADESDGTFLELAPRLGLITNIEADHIDHYGSLDGMISAYRQFSETVGDVLLTNRDDLACNELRNNYTGGARMITFGTNYESDFRIYDVTSSKMSLTFKLTGPSGELGEFQMATPGKHMAMNAGAAIAIALEAGADLESSRKALLAFRGVGRRFQIEGEFQGVTFVDDYAHLPTEIEAVVGAASGGGWNRIICVFQPHRFTRLSAIWKTYGASFRLANEVVVTELYSAGEDPIEGISSQLIVDAIKSTDPSRKVSRLEDRGDLFAYLRNELRSGDLCLVLSAGDLVNIGRKVFADYPEKAQGLA